MLPRATALGTAVLLLSLTFPAFAQNKPAPAPAAAPAAKITNSA